MRKTAQTNKQTDTTKIMVTWPWTNKKIQKIYYYNVYSTNKSNDSVKITQNKCRLLTVSHTHQHVPKDIIPFKFTRNIAKIRQSAILPRRMCNLVAPPGESQWVICHVANCKPASVFGQSQEIMMTLTKLELHKSLHLRETRTEPWSQVMCRKFLKSGHVVFDICMQMDTLITTLQPSRGWSNNDSTSIFQY